MNKNALQICLASHPISVPTWRAFRAPCRRINVHMLYGPANLSSRTRFLISRLLPASLSRLRRNYSIKLAIFSATSAELQVNKLLQKQPLLSIRTPRSSRVVTCLGLVLMTPDTTCAIHRLSCLKHVPVQTRQRGTDNVRLSLILGQAMDGT